MSLSVKKKDNKGASLADLKAFLRGASAAQQAQVKMIYRVFEIMDADRDGVLSFTDVKSYFRSIGRLSDDVTVRKWIQARDIDQRGTVSLPEFVASFSHQLDPSSRGVGVFAANSRGNETSTSLITYAFGTLRLGNSPPEVLIALQAAEEYLRRALDSPSIEAFWRISIKDNNFHQTIGRLFGGIKLMHALGFSEEQNGSVLALRDENGSKWTVIPNDIRQMLNRNLEELNLHKQSLSELSISHIAAGKKIYYEVKYKYLSCCFVVSSAIELQGDTVERCTEWGLAMESILTMLNNILKYPKDPKFYRVNTANPNFHRR